MVGGLEDNEFRARLSGDDVKQILILPRQLGVNQGLGVLARMVLAIEERVCQEERRV